MSVATHQDISRLLDMINERDNRVAELEKGCESTIADFRTGEMTTLQVASRAYERAIRLLRISTRQELRNLAEKFQVNS